MPKSSAVFETAPFSVFGHLHCLPNRLRQKRRSLCRFSLNLVRRLRQNIWCVNVDPLNGDGEISNIKENMPSGITSNYLTLAAARIALMQIFRVKTPANIVTNLSPE